MSILLPNNNDSKRLAIHSKIVEVAYVVKLSRVKYSLSIMGRLTLLAVLAFELSSRQHVIDQVPLYRPFPALRFLAVAR